MVRWTVGVRFYCAHKVLKLHSVSYRKQEGPHEDEDAGVEAVGPASIRRRGQLLPLEQIVDVVQHQRVGVEEDALLELRQSPTVQLRERNAQLRPAQPRVRRQ